MTPAGRNLAILTALAYIAGSRLGWLELLVPAATGVLALALGVPAILTRPRLRVERLLEPSRVAAGDPAIVVLRVTNEGSRRTGPASRIEDRIGDVPIDMPIKGLARGETVELTREVTTDRRGIIEIGPARAVKGDALGLFRRWVAQSPMEQLWVHPRHVPVSGVPAGFARDFEGLTSESSPAGDVSFHALREYEIGDDYRHIHWMTTARTGRLMVRQYVDNRLPEVHLVLDLDPDRYRSRTVSGAVGPGPGALFDTAVEIAATIGTGTMDSRRPLTVQLGQRPVAPAELLDELSLVTTRRGPLRLRPPDDASVAVVVTGCDVAPVTSPHPMHVVVVRVGRDRLHPPLPGTLTLDVESLDEFQMAWNAVMSQWGQG